MIAPGPARPQINARTRVIAWPCRLAPLARTRTAQGRHRHVGDPPPAAQPVEPTIDDGHLLLVGPQAATEPIAA